MKRYRITMLERTNEVINNRINRGNPICIYTDAENEEEARKYFDNNFSRFNDLIKIEEV